jgi:hypothetical protein
MGQPVEVRVLSRAVWLTGEAAPSTLALAGTAFVPMDLSAVTLRRARVYASTHSALAKSATMHSASTTGGNDYSSHPRGMSRRLTNLFFRRFSSCRPASFH